MRVSIREHVIVADHENHVWKLVRDFFQPNDPRTLNDQIQTIVIETENETEDQLLNILLYEKPSSVLNLSKITGMSVNDVEDFLGNLEKFDLIEKKSDATVLTDSELIRYSRQLRFFSLYDAPTIIQEKMKKAKVVVVGLGGIGGWLLFNLAAMGIGNLVGYDHDKIELSNLNRQLLFSEKDIGKCKSDIAEQRIAEFNSNIKITTKNLLVTEKNIETIIPEDATVFVSTAFPIEYYANAFCVKHDIPIIAQGGGKYSPTGVSVMRPHLTGCFNCLPDSIPAWRHLTDLVRARHGEDYVLTTTFSPFVSICANIMAVEIFKLVTGLEKPINNIVIDPIGWKVEENKNQLVKNPLCKICGGRG